MGVCRASTRISGSPTIAVLFLYIRLIVYIKEKKKKNILTINMRWLFCYAENYRNMTQWKYRK